jgi:hypothetical protein
MEKYKSYVLPKDCDGKKFILCLFVFLANDLERALRFFAEKRRKQHRALRPRRKSLFARDPRPH